MYIYVYEQQFPCPRNQSTACPYLFRNFGTNRILLIYAVAEKSRNVNKLAEIVGISQSAASRHLKVLRERGLIQSQRNGAQVIYSLADERFIQALDLLREVMLEQLSQQADLINKNKPNER